MSAYENVVAGKLRLKGRALDVRGRIIRKKKKPKRGYDQLSRALGNDQQTDLSLTELSNYDSNVHSEREDTQNERLTQAERRYLEQWQKIELQRLAKVAKKSHRDRVQEFNQYLANLSEHYDIPKVGPG
ncbi:hypothetical protein ACJIZ3_004313 [Penstemon smallii]|uniref:Protein FAM32A-like n=1 Tax=Penstemon smallii TaxID=265156 RepID=A0ABD3S1N2_9LAMI